MTESTHTPPSDTIILNAFEKQQEYAIQLKQSTATERIKKLRKISSWVEQHAADIRQAIYKDFRKPGPEVDLTEIFPVQQEIKHTIGHLKKWMKPGKVSTPLALAGSKSYVYYEPKGVALIIAPWNFPLNLMLLPLISAISAGCTAILKPSEVTPHTARLIRNMMEDLFEPKEVVVFEGAVETSQALLQLPFDHIFFTGSPAVGKIVMKAAAENLTSVTLELGGKSPAIIDSSARLSDAAEKIAWGKWLNNGQTCIAPDYLLVNKNQQAALADEIIKATEKFFSEDGQSPQQSADYARIVNRNHYERLCELLDDAREKGAKILMGGQRDAEEKYIAPTLLADVPENARIWEEEIFGPILPMRKVDDLRDAADYIRKHPKPLALYLFSNSKKNQQYVLDNTSAGGMVINDCLLHYLHPNLPFGGINHSGLGKAHGFWGFRAFSNEKALIKQRIGLTSIKPVYPPYTSGVKKLISLMMKYL
ncbi:aldehyde dehydrogenase family protein [Nafulsella turpanensis]|uniref:aldehyde dehydrogenase family protein n=1 Tax=Nafulsella turpanensis TaxID=1265690 RepID=UPI0003461B15|nr:aldehyde dehydrogenase family protein [Nafulsella turpanensis]